MRNNQNCTVSKCEKHCLKLKAIHKEKRPSLNAVVSFCKGPAGKGKRGKQSCASYQRPVLNRDQNHATPAFILPCEQADYINGAAEFKKEHDLRVREYQEEDSMMFVPKPRSKNMYCNVCREHYDEYLEHIKSAQHRTNIRAAPIQQHILELQQTFHALHPHQPSPAEDNSSQQAHFQATSRKRARRNQDDRPFTLPFFETNQNCSPNGSTQAVFMPAIPHYCYEDFNSRLMGGMQPFLMYPWQMGGIYPMYCLPIPSMMPIEAFHC